MSSRPHQPLSRRMRDTVRAIASAHGVRSVRVFGSLARGEGTAGSDLDLLVEMPEGSTLLDLAGLQLDLEEAVGRKVDVVPADSLKPALRSRILSDARPL